MNHKKNSSNYGYMIAAIIFLISAVGSYPQYQLSPLAYLIMPELELSLAQFSAVFSSPMIPGILLSLIAGILKTLYGNCRYHFLNWCYPSNLFGNNQLYRSFNLYDPVRCHCNI